MVIGKLRKVGNSFVVTVPRQEMEALGLSEGDIVVVEIRKAEVRPMLRPDIREMADESWKRNEAGYRYLAGR